MIFTFGLLFLLAPLLLCMLWPGLVTNYANLMRLIILSVITGMVMMTGSVLYWLATNLP